MSSSSATVREEAQYWLLRMSSGEAGVEDEKALEAWLARSEQHRRQFIELQQLWQELDHLPESAWLESEVAAPKLRPWLPLALAASLAAVMLTATLLWQNLSGLPSPASQWHYATQIAEHRSVSLEDGSALELGARSRLSVEFDADQRRVLLQGGEVFFDVVQDRQRPFLIDVGVGTVRVLGTAFSIHRQGDQITVAVLRGQVAVSRGSHEESLSAGQRLKLSQTELYRLEDYQLDQIASWREGRRVFRDSPLAEVVADLNRYSPVPILIADTRLASQRVTGAFDNFADVPAVLEAIELSLPARVTRTSERVLLGAP
ncbi:FecR family protein [Parahaliea sp. F7430]|uniref:FecR family protein n=1 Tax=Sediminihaliea albiluteola TaxID=2758564 RepID=A0A7W2YHV1_9GAMM|nr:FecR family protein [Sediminihaliea albiluteola]MBA6411831.1 FecR family protein [Sediminihaliea albiluteola]